MRSKIISQEDYIYTHTYTHTHISNFTYDGRSNKSTQAVNRGKPITL